jgi:hypothetical protein
MNIKSCLFIVLSLATLASCSSMKPKKHKGCDIMGKSAVLNYPGFRVEAKYIDETNIHWKTDKAEGHENISYKKVGPHLHFLNWIEKDGITVSQVINCKANTVTAFLSQKDTKSKRGQRAGMLMEGVIEFKE